MNRPIIIAVAAIFTLGLGLGHRVITAGGLRDGLSISQQQIDGLPDVLAAWAIVNREPIDEQAIELLLCRSHGNLSYKNSLTQADIVVTVLSGPSGPLAAHTPEVCYSSQAYLIRSESDQLELKLDDGSVSRFRVVDLTPRGENHKPLTVIYGWHDGNGWRSPSPGWCRIAYAGSKSLVKVQAAIVTTDDASNESVKDRQQQLKAFLTEFLPELNAQLKKP